MVYGLWFMVYGSAGIRDALRYDIMDDNNHPLVNTNNTSCKPFKLALWEFRSKLITSQNE